MCSTLHMLPQEPRKQKYIKLGKRIRMVNIAYWDRIRKLKYYTTAQFSDNSHRTGNGNTTDQNRDNLYCTVLYCTFSIKYACKCCRRIEKADWIKGKVQLN